MFHPWPEVLNQNVGRPDQAFQDCDSTFVFQIESDCALVTLQVLKIRTIPRKAKDIAGGGRHLDFDHIRPPVGKLSDTSRAGTNARQVNHTKMRQCFAHGNSLSSGFASHPPTRLDSVEKILEQTIE
jgi:hypothetical protein